MEETAGAGGEQGVRELLWDCSLLEGGRFPASPPPPLKGATGGGARALEEQVGVSFWSTLGRAGPEQLAHLALRNSRSHLPGTCPRAHGSRVAPGSQSPQTIGQQVFWGGTPGQHPLASPDGPVQVREDCP